MPRRPTPPAVAYRLADAVRRRWWRIRRPALRGAFVLVRHDDSVLLVRNAYRRSHGLPGGGVKRREGPAMGALRELREEVGIRLPPAALRYGATIVHEMYGCIDTVSFFEAVVDGLPEVRIDGREVIWAGFVPIAELAGLRFHGPIRLYLQACGLLR